MSLCVRRCLDLGDVDWYHGRICVNVVLGLLCRFTCRKEGDLVGKVGTFFVYSYASRNVETK